MESVRESIQYRNDMINQQHLTNEERGLIHTANKLIEEEKVLEAIRICDLHLQIHGYSKIIHEFKGRSF